jgi:hypothetical protein
MDIQRTPLHGPHRETQKKAEQQREYRERERLAFRNLLAALKEVGSTNPRSRCDILRKGGYSFEVLLFKRAKLTRKSG